MSKFSGRKVFQHEMFNRHVGEIRSLLHALELRDSFEPGGNRPPMDMYETAGEVIVEFDLPGVCLDAISLRMSGMTLTLEADKPRDLHDGTYVRVERHHGTFQHSVQLPGNIDAGAVRAEYRMGVVRVICPKSGERLVPIKEI